MTKEVLCINDKGWKDEETGERDLPGPKFNDVCVVTGQDTDRYQIAGYPPSWGYKKEFFVDLIGDALLEKMLTEIPQPV